MFSELSATINKISIVEISSARKNILQPLIDFIQQKTQEDQEINLNFICTHNSRRSHFAQIWAQTAAYFYGVKNVFCYSGGTEETALFPKVVETLAEQGFHIVKIVENENPIYAIKFDENASPIIGFSKKYNHPFNPKSDFAAVMTCSQADAGCPFVIGASKRIPITFEDPKLSDNLPNQVEVYRERSLEIAAEIFYVFSKIIK